MGRRKRESWSAARLRVTEKKRTVRALDSAAGDPSAPMAVPSASTYGTSASTARTPQLSSRRSTIARSAGCAIATTTGFSSCTLGSGLGRRLSASTAAGGGGSVGSAPASFPTTKGIFTKKVVPTPGAETNEMEPPKASMMRLVITCTDVAGLKRGGVVFRVQRQERVLC